ncbi:MAG TPA: hypothetical protein GX708_21720 [Gallicola sp.]|nr:hypothetical protein [Gallicola sp.]
MNWLDITLIITNVLLFIVGIVMIIVAIIRRNDIWSNATFLAIIYWVNYIIIAPLFLIVIPFVVLDKSSGSTIGIVTSVDKNFFGTTAIYIKTSETTQEKYCIEDEKIVNQAKELIGKEVKIEYGTRVGFYSTGKCGQAPVEKIEMRNE